MINKHLAKVAFVIFEMHSSGARLEQSKHIAIPKFHTFANAV